MLFLLRNTGGFGKAPKNEPLYMPIGRHYYLENWLCEIDDGSYSVKCLIGPRINYEYAVAPEYLPQLGSISVYINELDDNHEPVREIARLSRYEPPFNRDKEKKWCIYYSSKEGYYEIYEDNDSKRNYANQSEEYSENKVNVTDIRAVFDHIAQKTRLQYGEIQKKVPGDRFAIREINGWEKVRPADEPKRPTHIDFEQETPLARLAEGVKDTNDNGKALERPSETGDIIQ